MIPSKLKQGDEIRIIAPSKSLSLMDREHVVIATQRLEELGFKVTFSKNSKKTDEFMSSPIQSRIDDLHDAFGSPMVKGIITVLGGENCNQLLRYIDYSLIQSNPKVFCGYSDITALSNAFYAKTGLISYSGPNFSSFAMLKGFDYTLDCFKKCLMEAEEFDIQASDRWSDDQWYKNGQNHREFIDNQGWHVINKGEVEGILIGGNLCTLNLLQGTEYMPSLENTVLFLEDDHIVTPETFDRDLQSLIHQPGFEGVKGIVIGRFQKASQMTKEKLTRIIKTKKELTHLPVTTDVDFGHTTPQVTFPIGGTTQIMANENQSRILIKEH